MKFESPYLKQGFSKQTSKAYLYMFVVGMITAYMFSGLYYGYINSDERLPGLFYHVFYGLSHISLVGVFTTFLIGIVISLLLIVAVHKTNDGIKLIVYIEFDDEARQVRIKSRYALKPDVIEHTAKYGELRVKNEEKIRDDQ